jgi:hypothetical protein
MRCDIVICNGNGTIATVYPYPRVIIGPYGCVQQVVASKAGM